MLAIGRGLMANPRLLLLDEISLGLAPSWSADSTASCGRSRREGTTTLVVEQDVSQIMELAQRVYCLRKGAVVARGPARGPDARPASPPPTSGS